MSWLDAHRRRQLVGLVRLEVRRLVTSRRLFGLLALAFGPVALVLIWALTPIPRRAFESPAGVMTQFATLFYLYCYVSVILGSLLVFMSLFRSEVLERSLHYLYLTPVHRTLVVVGKYLAGVLVAGSVFATAAASLYMLMVLPFGLGATNRWMWGGTGFEQLLAYVTVALLATAGYGAIFLLAGLLFRNPIPPAALVWGWETLYFILPATAKKFSVIHYLRSFYPVPPSEWFGGLFSVMADPASPFLALPGLLVFSGVLVAVAAWRAGGMEVAYGDD